VGYTVATGDFFVRRYKLLIGVFIVISLVAIHGIRVVAENPLEYDFDKLRNKISKVKGTAAFEKDIRRPFATSNSPSVVLLDSAIQAEEICPAVRAIKAKADPVKNVIHTCSSLYDILPKPNADRAAQLAAFTRIRALLANKLIKYAKEAELLGQLRDQMRTDPPTLQDIPIQLSRPFREKDGSVGKIAFVYPINEKSINKGENLLSFIGALGAIELPKSGTTVSAAGDAFILADLLEGIKKDGPLVAGLAFGGVALISVFLAGGLRAGLLMCFLLALSTSWMIAAQGWFGIKYNFFNFIALPLTFGIGVDYPINVYLRCREEKFRNFGRILASSGMAVFLCSLTTIIGYATLLGATSQALASFGRLAIIGEITCIVSALIVLPVLLRTAGGFKDRADPLPATATAAPGENPVTVN